MNTTTAAQRTNKRHDKIFEEAEGLKRGEFEKLKNKRNYTVSDGAVSGCRHSFHSCDKKTAYEASRIMMANGINTGGDICGSPAVGGYYATGLETN